MEMLNRDRFIRSSHGPPDFNFLLKCDQCGPEIWSGGYSRPILYTQKYIDNSIILEVSDIIGYFTGSKFMPISKQ